MIPLLTPVEAVASVRAPAGSLRQAADGARSDKSAQAVRNSSRGLGTHQPAPLATDQGIRLNLRPGSDEVIATLVNTKTNETIRVIPGEETRRAGDVIRGIAGQILDKLA